MKYINTFIAALFALTALTGCKTNEANYRAAYEVAKQKSAEDSGIDGTIYDRMRRETIASILTSGNTEMPMNTAMVSVAEGCGQPSDLKRYSVVVNQFKQIFNARSFMQRLRDNGYNAIVAQTGEPLYYVIATSCDTPEEAKKAYTRVKDDKNIIMRDPFPWILNNPRAR